MQELRQPLQLLLIMLLPLQLLIIMLLPLQLLIIMLLPLQLADAHHATATTFADLMLLLWPCPGGCSHYPPQELMHRCMLYRHVFYELLLLCPCLSPLPPMQELMQLYVLCMLFIKLLPLLSLGPKLLLDPLKYLRQTSFYAQGAFFGAVLFILCLAWQRQVGGVEAMRDTKEVAAKGRWGGGHA